MELLIDSILVNLLHGYQWRGWMLILGTRYRRVEPVPKPHECRLHVSENLLQVLPGQQF